MKTDVSRLVLGSIGLVLSAYAVYVEYKMEHKAPEEEFTALCDIEFLGASCSKVFTTPEGKMMSYAGLVEKGSAFDLPNAALGILYYSWQLFLTPIPALQPLTKLATTGAMASSVWLAYQLTFVLGDLCLLCWSTHVINTLLFLKIVVGPLVSGASGSSLKVKKL